ncbi:MAG: von Willebrand factor type domain protein [Gemmataceae bacterium]|nr:von Willebrand factor type domain protein [Gemmataceae bacterium]
MAKAAAGRSGSTGTSLKKTPTKSVAKAGPTTRPKKKAAGNVPELAPAAPLARPTTRTKFTLFNLLGQPRAYYLVEPMDLPRPPADPKAKAVAHSIIVVDRSGSMYSAMADTRNTLLKLLTLDEYAQFNLVVTLISYSSEGDVTCHFERAPIREIMKRGSKYQQDISRLQVTGATCISQGLRMAIEKTKADELTAITLHSDGYANDPSATTEATTLTKLTGDLKGKDAFVNTIAYTDYSDFRLLSRVANSGSGACVKAGNIGQVYNSLYSSTKVLGSSVTPPIEVPLEKGFDYQVFVSRSAGRINGADEALSIRGLRADDDGVVYKYRKLTRAEYDTLDVPEMQTSEAVFAFSRGNLAEGNLNTAKYALGSTFDATLVATHGRALTNNQVAAFAGDLDTLVLFNPGQLAEHTILTEVPVNRRIPLLSLIKVLDDNRANFAINRKSLQDVYVRRGLKRLQGTRDEAGKLVEPTLKTEFANEDEYLPISSFDVNRNTATLNMMLTRKVRLVPAAGGPPIAQVAGIKLDDLSTFNNYTLVGDGELNVPYLKLKITDKKLFDTLQKEGVLEADGAPAGAYDATQEYTLRLDQLPVVPPFEGSINLTGVFDEIARLKVMSSLCAAHLKEEAAELTPEQVEELKKHYLSKSLFLNFPTTNPYTDLKQALAEGSVDTRTSYKIDVGDRTILNLSKLHSANKFLERMYEVVGPDGKPLEKPAFEDVLDGTVTYKHKQLSAKTKVTKIDEFMKGLFDDVLGLKPTGAAVKVLESVGATKLAAIVKDRAKGKQPGRKEFVDALTDARKKLEARSEDVFREKLSPLVFYVGATGLLPDEVEAKALSADQLQAKYPDLALSKDEKEGTFFELGDTILCVYAKTEYFSR